MTTLDIVQRYWEGNTNSSPKAKKIKKLLEANGHTEVYVWWENMGQAFEMCGCSGGYMCVTKELNDVEPLGFSLDEAIEHVTTAPWMNKRDK